MLCLSGFELYSRWVPLKVAYNPNTFFLNWKQLKAGKAVEDALQYIRMYVAGV